LQSACLHIFMIELLFCNMNNPGSGVFFFCLLLPVFTGNRKYEY